MPERYFQTTPVFYVNERPHLGTAYSMVIADALARWHRLIGDEVYFLTGTDEYGLKIARRASEEGVDPQTWVDQMSTYFRQAWIELGISIDDFIRTTEDRHTLAVQRFMQSMYDNGYIYKGDYAGWYCVSCEAYYTADELVDSSNCPIHLRPVEWLVEENYFFALSRFSEQLEKWYGDNPGVVLPDSRRNEALGQIRQGLTDISITRTSFDWGVRVPWDDEHVFYVWSDALVNYVTAIGYGADPERFALWWPAACHLIGKDIVKFHCVWWPAMCMAAGIDPPHQIVAHGWLLVAGEKMSKSRTNQVDPLELAEDIGVDPLRYHLLRDVVVGSDGDFSYESLVERYNADLANNLGNLCQRIATVVAGKCNGIGPAPREASPEHRLAGVAAAVVSRARLAWTRFAPNEALAAAFHLIHETNAELETTEPWKLPPGRELEEILGDALEALRIVTILISPAMPATAVELWRRIGLDGAPDEPGRAGADRDELSWGHYPGGRPVDRATPLFPRRSMGLAAATPSQ